MIALIPARSGSKRVPDKNIRHLNDRPLLTWTLEAAVESTVYDRVYFCTDSEEYAKLALQWSSGFEVIMRPKASDTQQDIVWVRHALETIRYREDTDPDKWFSILRPTSPFRDAQSIQRAAQLWEDNSDHFDSLRGVREAQETAWKQWHTLPDTYRIAPVMNLVRDPEKDYPWCSPTQTLAKTYIQTGGIEICKTKVALEQGSICGSRVLGFILNGPESLDINTVLDWTVAEALSEVTREALQDLGGTQTLFSE